MALPADYIERVYAGVLGKLIGVYLGRPFEGWTYERIMQELGEVWYYVHEKRGAPLIVTDDDISGTFTFLRALPDHRNARELTPAQIGQTWLNYIIERRTILWWGGMGNSTEHTAFLRLKNGVAAPASGSIARNGTVVAEQIGSQIFIDGWAMVAPGDPELAADLARRAASVSHDGEAIYGAQVLAAMEAQAFVERDLNALLDTAVRFIPNDSTIARLINDVREWHAEFHDWHQARDQIAQHYGYDKFGGNCHMVPNHALIHLGLLYGGDDFQKALMITNTAGWDTDCNSGNVGCLLGIKNGLASLDAGPDWRGPVADRLYLPTADGGRAITDALTEAYHVANIGRALANEPPVAPKAGARFHFALPGSVQGWQADARADTRGTLTLENATQGGGERALALRFHGVAPGRSARATTATFIPPEAKDMAHYGLLASPTLYSGQTIRARIVADAANAASTACRLFIEVYGTDDLLERVDGPSALLAPGADTTWEWSVPATGGAPIAAVGVEIYADAGPSTSGSLYLDYLGWEGAPDVALGRPAHGGTMWRRAWVDGVDQWDRRWPEDYRLVQNAGQGLISQGTREWRDYRVRASVTPHLAEAAGVSVRVQGLRRHYALLLRAGQVALVRSLDGEQVLAEAPFDWTFGASYALELEVVGDRLRGLVNGAELVAARDGALEGGGVALICAEGRVAFGGVEVRPI